MKVNTESERFIRYMEKFDYTLTGKIQMVAWGIWEGDFQAPHTDGQRVQFDTREAPAQIIFLKKTA